MELIHFKEANHQTSSSLLSLVVGPLTKQDAITMTAQKYGFAEAATAPQAAAVEEEEEAE